MVAFVGRGLLGADGPHEAEIVSLEPHSIPGDIWILIFENIVFI